MVLVAGTWYPPTLRSIRVLLELLPFGARFIRLRLFRVLAAPQFSCSSSSYHGHIGNFKSLSGVKIFISEKAQTMRMTQGNLSAKDYDKCGLWRINSIIFLFLFTAFWQGKEMNSLIMREQK